MQYPGHVGDETKGKRMTASNGTMTTAEARVWMQKHAEKVGEDKLPEGVTVPGPRGRISAATKSYISKKSRKLIVPTPPATPTGVKAKLAAYVASGKSLPDGVTVTAGRGRLSKAAADFAASL